MLFSLLLFLFLSGKAGPVSIKSSPDGDERTRYALEWVAESITAITAFKLQYRKVSEHYVETANTEVCTKIEIKPQEKIVICLI